MISLLVVNYRSAAMAADAIRTARAASSEPLHVIVVDNSVDRTEADRLRPHADVLVVSHTNRGYAGAINDGRRHCAGDIVIVANPDVVFFAAAIDRLAEALQEPRRAVAGPALFWDEEQQWILPPADRRTLREKLDEAAGSRIRVWGGLRDRRRFRARLAFWSLRETTPVSAISGAVMAIRLADFDTVGGFDDRFALYFEESDFLRRIRRAGREVVYVPAARCRHIYNQSAGEDRERASGLYAASELAYWSKWYGRGVAATVASLPRQHGGIDFMPCAKPMVLPREGLIVEASPLPTFATAAGHVSSSTVVDVPPDVWVRYRDAALYLRAMDPHTARCVAACVRYRS